MPEIDGYSDDQAQAEVYDETHVDDEGDGNILLDEADLVLDVTRMAGDGRIEVQFAFDGETHGFLALGNVLPAAGRAVNQIGTWARQLLA